MSEESKVDFCGVFCNRGAELAALRAENKKLKEDLQETDKTLSDRELRLAEMQSLNAEMLAELKKIEREVDRCPSCRNAICGKHSHTPDCTLSALIKKAEAL